MRPFTLEAPESAVDALRLAGSTPNAQYLAGGTNLLDLMKLDVLRPDTLIDLTVLRREHGRIEVREDGLHLGSGVHMSEAADHPGIRRDYPVRADSLWMAASPQLRNMATLGGNALQRTRCPYFRDTSRGACNKRKPGSGRAAMGGVHRRHAVPGVSQHCIASYPGDFGVALAALGATVSLQNPNGVNREMTFDDLHRLPGDTPHIETTLRRGELITGLHVPFGPWTRRSLYLKIRDRSSYDFALASAAVALEVGADGRVRTARIGLGGLVTRPWRSVEAETVLKDRFLDENAAKSAADAAFAGAITHRDTVFKPELGRQTLIRALLQAARMEV